MKRVVGDQRLGFYATVGEDGSPNLAEGNDLRPRRRPPALRGHPVAPTVANIRRGSTVELNVVDPLVRKGYCLKGPAEVHEPGTDLYAAGIERLRKDGSTLTGRVRAIVVIEVREARPLVSPAYDDGSLTEADLVRTFRARFAELHGGAPGRLMRAGTARRAPA